MDEGRFGALLITPTAVVMLFVLAVPIGYAFVMSLNRIELTISPDWDFAGLKNYADLLVNKQVQAAVPRTLFFAALNVILTTGGATIMALVLNEPFKRCDVALHVSPELWPDQRPAARARGDR
jgi:multiple sugar transport system permease protein